MRKSQSIKEETETIIVQEKLDREGTVRNYSKGRFLGKGGFARVYEFLNLQTKHQSASKVIPKSSLSKARTKQKLMSQIKIHRSLRHPHIVSFEHFFQDSQNVYILLQLCPNQTLNQLLRRRKRLTQLQAQCYLKQACLALQYLHTHRVIHRDIKLGNLFLNEKMELKLGDFGLAAKLEYQGEKKRTICGTPNYIAPEILEGRSGHSYEVDVWSLGVLAYTLLVGKPPFETQDVKTTYRRIKMNAYSFPENISLSIEAKHLIFRALNGDPTQRPSIEELMKDPFFTKNSIPSVMPISTLAVPPSVSFLQKFSSTRRSSEIPHNEPQNMRQPLTARPLSSQGRASISPLTRNQPRNSQSKRIAFSSSYKGLNCGPQIWVSRWVDYSSKYGLGYLLSNGLTGVYFNDSTKMVSNGNLIQYVSKKNDSQKVHIYSSSDYPSHLQKKVTLLNHFKKQLSVDFKPRSSSNKTIYIKKWLITPYAVIFRLSNKLVQVIFTDKTELLLCSERKLVAYVDKTHLTQSYPLSSAIEEGSQELSKRLRYTKEALTNMLQPTDRQPLTDRCVNQPHNLIEES